MTERCVNFIVLDARLCEHPWGITPNETPFLVSPFSVGGRTCLWVPKYLWAAWVNYVNFCGDGILKLVFDLHDIPNRQRLYLQ